MVLQGSSKFTLFHTLLSANALLMREGAKHMQICPAAFMFSTVVTNTNQISKVKMIMTSKFMLESFNSLFTLFDVGCMLTLQKDIETLGSHKEFE